MSEVGKTRPRWILVTVALTLAVTGATAAPFDVPDEIAEALVESLAERYDVIALRRGYALRPSSPQTGFALLEIESEGILVDGERSDPDRLRDLLGADAEVLLALAGDPEALASFERRRSEGASEPKVGERELEADVRRQVEELERLDSGRSPEPGSRRERRDPRRVRSETRVSLGSSLTVRENESARDVVVIFGPLDVRGEVRGDSVVVLGSAEITGRLEGLLTVVGGNVSIGPEAVVEGDVNCVGGVVHSAPGARIEGEISEVSMAPFSVDLPGFELEGWNPFGDRGSNHRQRRWVGFVGTVLNSVLLAALLLVSVLVARRRVTAVAERVRSEPWKSGLIGFVVEILIAPVFLLISLLLLISVVGIPVLIVLVPFAVLAFFVVLILGYSGVALALGQALRPRWAGISPFLAVLLGLVLVQSWQILGEGLAFSGSLVRLTGYFLIFFGLCFKYLVWTVGLGAVMLDRFSPLPAPAPAPSWGELESGDFQEPPEE